MPWKRKGKNIYKELPDGSLKLKQECDSVDNAKAALRLLWMKAGEKGETKKGRKKS